MQSKFAFTRKWRQKYEYNDLREKYMNKEFVIITNTERTVLNYQ